MAISVLIPQPLQSLVGGKDSIEVECITIAEMVEQMEAAYPGIKERICEGNGRLRRFVNIYYNDEDIRFLDNMQTKLKDGDEVAIIPAIAGGARNAGRV